MSILLLSTSILNDNIVSNIEYNRITLMMKCREVSCVALLLVLVTSVLNY